MSEITIKKAVVTSLIVSAMLVPFSATAASVVHSGKNAFGYIWGNNGALNLSVVASESVTKDRSNKDEESGASVWGSNYTADACWYGYNTSTEMAEFKATGSMPSHLIASGSVNMTWYDWCGGHSSFTEEVTFSMDLTAMTDFVSFEKGMMQSGYGNIKVIQHVDNSSAPAGGESHITSPAFGTVTGSAEIGKSKIHGLEIIHD